VIARVTTIEGPPDRQLAGIQLFEEDALSWLREATGYVGWVVFHDRARGKTVSIVLWKDAEAEQENLEAMTRLRELATSAVGSRSEESEVLELVLADGVDFERGR
jgi:hypothetical protein